MNIKNLIDYLSFSKKYFLRRGHRGFLITLRNVENLRRHIGKNASFNNGYEQKDKQWWSKRLLI